MNRFLPPLLIVLALLLSCTAWRTMSVWSQDQGDGVRCYFTTSGISCLQLSDKRAWVPYIEEPCDTDHVGVLADGLSGRTHALTTGDVNEMLCLRLDKDTYGWTWINR